MAPKAHITRPLPTASAVGGHPAAAARTTPQSRDSSTTPSRTAPTANRATPKGRGRVTTPKAPLQTRIAAHHSTQQQRAGQESPAPPASRTSPESGTPSLSPRDGGEGAIARLEGTSSWDAMPRLCRGSFFTIEEAPPAAEGTHVTGRTPIGEGADVQGRNPPHLFSEFGVFNCPPPPRDVASALMPWRRRCPMEDLLSRSEKGKDTLQKPSPSLAAVEWWGSQLRRGVAAPPSPSTAGDASVTGAAASAMGGLFRADHIFIATTAISAGRPCDALAAIEALVAMDPVLGLAERQLFFDAASAFIDKKALAVRKAADTVKLTGNSAAHAALVLEWLVPDLTWTVARVVRLITHYLLPGSLIPAKHTTASVVTYLKWVLDFILVASRTVVHALQATGDLETLLPAVEQQQLMRPILEALSDEYRHQPVPPPPSSSSPKVSPPHRHHRSTSPYAGRGSIHGALSWGASRVLLLESLLPVPRGDTAMLPDALMERTLALYVSLAEDAQVLLPATHPLRVAVCIGSLTSLSDDRGGGNAALRRRLKELAEGMQYELSLAIGDVSNRSEGAASALPQLHLLKSALDAAAAKLFAT